MTVAAGSGKTTAIETVSNRLKEEGVPIYTLSETATELLKAGFDPVNNRSLFQKKLFELQLERERNYKKHISLLLGSSRDEEALLLDRGLLDGSIYIDRQGFVKIAAQNGFTVRGILDSYFAIVQMQSTVCFMGKKTMNIVWEKR